MAQPFGQAIAGSGGELGRGLAAAGQDTALGENFFSALRCEKPASPDRLQAFYRKGAGQLSPCPLAGPHKGFNHGRCLEAMRIYPALGIGLGEEAQLPELLYNPLARVVGKKAGRKGIAVVVLGLNREIGQVAPAVACGKELAARFWAALHH